MGIRKINSTSKKSNKIFRKTRSKRQRGGGNIPSGFFDSNRDDDMALIRACGRGDEDLVAQLLAAGADVNATGDDGYTALYAASYNEHTEIVAQLLAAGADVNATNSGFTALFMASQKGHTEIVAQLLAAGLM